jgi:hypothetical protein
MNIPRYLSLLLALTSSTLYAVCAAQEVQAPQEELTPGVREPSGRLMPDGRIEDYPRPKELTHPERWRYFPRERIVEGGFLDRLLVSSFVSPIVFRDSDVGTGGGVALTDIDFRERRRQEFAGIFLSHTTQGQQNYSFVWRRWQNHIDLPNKGVLQEERSHLTVRGGYQRVLTKRFFGFGDETSRADESSYTDETFFLGASMRQSLPEAADNLIGSAGLRFETHNLSDGEVSDVPSTADAYRTIFNEADQHQLVWVELGLSYDTRDSQVNPYNGWAVGLESQSALLQTGGDVGGRHGGFATTVFPVPPIFYSSVSKKEENRPTDTIAFFAEVQTSSGDLPFYSRPTLGGADRQRGYINGRFAGDSLWFSAAEHRFWVIPRGFSVTDRIRIERVGLATFYGKF